MNGLVLHYLSSLTVHRSQIKIPVVLMKSSDAPRFLSRAKLPTFDELEHNLASYAKRKSHSEL
jgi:hypothetical protein